MIYIKNMRKISEIMNKESKQNFFYNFVNWLDNKFINKIIALYKCCFNVVTVKHIGDKKIYILPWKKEKNDKMKFKKLNKIYEKIKNEKDKFVVLSNELNKDEQTVQVLYKQGFHILDGKWLFNLLMKKTIEYISQAKNKELKEQSIAFLINNPNDISVFYIKELAQEIKNLKIVTNNNLYFKRIEQKLYETDGIPISVVNNKKKSLLNNDIIVNIDFSEKELNKYALSRNAILVNIYNEVKIHSKAFCGININGYKISVSDEYMDLFNEYNLLREFDLKLIYESFIFSKSKPEIMNKTLKNDKVKIESLIGTKGEISKLEYSNNT